MRQPLNSSLLVGLHRENLENLNRLRIGKAIQIFAALGIAMLSWGLWSAYVVATSTCYLHGGPDNNNAQESVDAGADDPCMTGQAGFCLIDGMHSNAHNDKELCEGCGCQGQNQADANNAIDAKDGTFQSYLFADDTGRSQNVNDGTDATKASGQSANSAWSCSCGSAKWIDGYCDCSAFEDCFLTEPVHTKALCDTLDVETSGVTFLGTATYGENAGVWTKTPGEVGSCTGVPSSLTTYPAGCEYMFDHPTERDSLGNTVLLPFSDQMDRCPNGCVYTPAAGTCSVATWKRHVETHEDCDLLVPAHEWKDGHMDQGIWNNWLLAGIIMTLIDGGVLAFFWFCQGWQDAEAWGYIDIAL